MGGVLRTDRVMMWNVPDDPVSVRLARHLVTGVLEAWGLPGLVDDITLVVSELVTNALVHGAPPVSLSLCATPDTLIGRVYDGGDGRPRPLTLSDRAHHGRGLAIVATLTDSWRYDPAPYGVGKTVWFTRRLP